MQHKPLTLAEFKQRKKKLRNINQELDENLSRTERLASFITEKVGSFGFFIIIVIWTLLWLGWNLLAPKEYQFDAPMGFVLWLFISNLIQIMLMPLIMVGQNIQGKHSEARAQNDLEINIKAEEEIELILHHLEYQNAIMLDILQKLDSKK